MQKIMAEKRSVFGKKLKSVRLAGQMPAVLYGPKQETTALLLNTKEFKKLLATAGESSMVTIDAGEVKADVLIHDVTVHPVSGEPLHADLYAVDKTKTVKVKVPLRFEGVASAVKDLGGTLVKVLYELEVEVLPMNIPHDIEVDISKLVSLDSQILVSDLSVPKDVTVLSAPEEVVASIAVAKDEPVETAPVDLSAIEVEKKGKKVEEGEEAAAAA